MFPSLAAHALAGWSTLLATLSSLLHLAPHAAPYLMATVPLATGGGDGDGGDGGDDDDGGGAAPASVADAGAKYLEGLSAAERDEPLAGDLPDDDEGEPAKPAKPAAAKPKPADAAADDADDDTDQDDDEDVDLEGRAEKPVVDGAGKGKEGAAADAGADGAVKVTLPGLADRGEKDIEVEVDPEIADRIRRLKNEGLRAKEYGTRRAELESREAELAAIEQALEVDPVGFHLGQLTEARQLEVARALVLEHFDTLAPELEAFMDDPVGRLKALNQQQKALKKSGEALAHNTAERRHVAACLRAAESLIPETVDDATAREFMLDARHDLAAAATAGTRITPDTVKQILARRVARYAFDKVAPPPAPAGKKPGDSARPVSDKARDIAARRSGKPDAAATQARIRRTQAARNAGARVAPVGAGAAPTQVPALPAGADADVRSMSKALRESGKLPTSWTVRE